MMYPGWVRSLSRADFLKSVGLYVAPDRLFLVRMRKDLFRLSIVGEAEREISAGERTVSRRQEWSEAIRSLLPHFDPARDPFYICLSASQTISLRLLLPRVAAEDLRQVIEYEIERHVPLSRQDLYYDFLPVGETGEKIVVFLFAVLKKEMDGLLDALSTFGVEPKRVETTATAIANYLLFCASGIQDRALVLGEQGERLEVIGLDVGTDGWRKEPEMLFTHWLPRADWAGGPGREIFSDSLEGSAKLFGWGNVEDFLSSVNGETPQVENLLDSGRARLGGGGLGDSGYVPAIGAALAGLREATFQVNLLRGEREEGRSGSVTRLNGILAAALLIGLLVWGASYPIRDEALLRQVQTENQKLEASVTALRGEEEQRNRLRKELDFLRGLRIRRGEILEILDELSRIVPGSAYLSNLRYREGGVELQGSAENASNLVPILERSPVFQNVGFTAPSTRGRDNRETFSLKAELERVGGKAAGP